MEGATEAPNSFTNRALRVERRLRPLNKLGYSKLYLQISLLEKSQMQFLTDTWQKAVCLGTEFVNLE